MEIFRKFSLFTAIAVAVTLGGTLSSCNNDNEDDNYTRQTLSNSFGCVTSIGTQTQTISSSMTYVVTFNYSTGKATVEITGLEMPDGTKYPSILLEEMTWKMKDGWRTIEASAPKSSISGFAQAPIFENVSIGLLDRIYNNAYIPAFYVKARVNTQYSLFSALNQQVFFGKTETVDPEGRVVTTRSTGYSFIINPRTMPLTATIGVARAKFVNNMPAQDFLFEDVPCTLNGNGTLTFEAESLIPTQNKVPNTNFPISDLEGVYDFMSGLDMDFDCTAFGKKYSVTADLDYVSSPDE